MIGSVTEGVLKGAFFLSFETQDNACILLNLYSMMTGASHFSIKSVTVRNEMKSGYNTRSRCSNALCVIRFLDRCYINQF
jgi:hypothetical protein